MYSIAISSAVVTTLCKLLYKVGLGQEVGLGNSSTLCILQSRGFRYYSGCTMVYATMVYMVYAFMVYTTMIYGVPVFYGLLIIWSSMVFYGL